MIQSTGFDTEYVFLPFDLMKQAAATFWAKLAMHVFAIRHFALPGFGFSFTYGQFIDLNPECHAKCTTRLTLTIQTVACKQRQRLPGDTVMNVSTLALPGKFMRLFHANSIQIPERHGKQSNHRFNSASNSKTSRIAPVAIATQTWRKN